MDSLKRIIGEELSEIVQKARYGEKPMRVGLMASGSEHGDQELLEGALLARAKNKGVEVVMIGPKPADDHGFEWIETSKDEGEVAKAMEEALSSGAIDGAVALHYPFPLGVTTIGRVVTPAKGKAMFIASTTGTSSTSRLEAMVLNAIYGNAVAKAVGIENPKIGILNVEGAQVVYRKLSELVEHGYPLTFGESVRKDGGAILRGNDLLAGAVDVCVTDTLTGNVLIKLFSAFNTGGSYEALGWGYGPSVGKGWPYIVSIISRASGAPVICNAIEFTAEAARGKLGNVVERELKLAEQAGLSGVLDSMRQSAPTTKEEVAPPPAEPTEEEVHGIDVLSIEDAVKELWKNGIYAESAMGCTGPVVKVSAQKLAKATEVLKEKGYI
jgi:betaine reductase